jgi:vacuolar-type H+-ATPase subunit I/STV1
MKARFVIGYILLALGLLGSIYAASSFIRFIFAPPTGDIIGVLGAGLAWGAYLASSIFIIPGAILVRKHESFVRRAIGIIVILLGIIPQAVAYLHSTLTTGPTGPRIGPPPTGPAEPPIEIQILYIELILAFFIIPLILYLIPGILLALPSRSSQ